MANNENLKNSIAGAIKSNGNQEITGNILQNAILAVINHFGSGSVFMGVATPQTNPSSLMDVNMFYVADQNGVYANFGGISIENQELTFLSNKTGSWQAVLKTNIRGRDGSTILQPSTVPGPWGLYQMVKMPDGSLLWANKATSQAPAVNNADWERVGGSELGVPGGAARFESVQNIFSDNKALSLGALENGRYSSSTNTGTDTNSAYKISQFIPVLSYWKIYSSNAQAANSFSWQFDEYGQPLGVLLSESEIINETTYYRYKLHPRAKTIRVSGSTANMQAKSLFVTNGISSELNGAINDKSLDLNTVYSDNYFNYDESIPTASIDQSNGNVIAVNNLRVTPMKKIVGNPKHLVALYIQSNGFGCGFGFYNSAGVFISAVNIPNTGIQLYKREDPKFLVKVDVPSGAVFFRFYWDIRIFSGQEALNRNLYIVNARAANAPIFNLGYRNTPLTAEDVRNIFASCVGIDNNFGNLIMDSFGDSNLANDGGRGSVNNEVLQRMNPYLIRNNAVGGATLTSTEALFGQQYLTGGNTIIRQVERMIEKIINDPSFVKPNIVFLMGGTNDFDQGRHVTPAMLGSTPYDEYMEGNFMTVAPSFNSLKPLDQVNRGQVAGAIRYIIERILFYCPDVVFIISTPIQSTLHNQLSAQRTVRDIKYMAGRLSVPVIDSWHESGMPMVFDYGTERNYLADRVHVFTDTTQTKGANIWGKFMVNGFFKKFVPSK